MTSTPSVRLMEPSEVQLALDWAAQEGWNPGLHDATAFYAADPSGFLISELDGAPIGCISAVRYSSRFGFIGLYIIRPQWRGRGYGKQLWDTAWNRLTNQVRAQEISIGLDGILEREETYRKAGFRAAYRHIRHVYEPRQSEGIPDKVIPLAEIPLDAIAQFDAKLFPASRPQFLEPWLRLSGTAFGVIERERLVGYGVLRPCLQGFKIGPLFAERLDIAETLFQALTQCSDGGLVFIDIPDANSALPVLVERYRLHSVFTCVRMYWGNNPHLDVERIFGVTTLELG
jgi:GNAT superfamily N-acetyltransferase